MKTKTINIYMFDELSDEAKEKAIDDYRSQGYGYDWCDEWIDTLKAFCDLLNISIRDYSIGPYSHSYVQIDLPGYDFEPDELTGLRLRTWLINNYPTLFSSRKYIKSVIMNPDQLSRSFPFYVKRSMLEHGPNAGKYVVSLYSRITRTDEIVLTGYCADYDITAPIREFVKKPDLSMDLETLINDCIDSWIAGYVADMEFQDSDEYITENLINNEYEYDENGEQL